MLCKKQKYGDYVRTTNKYGYECGSDWDGKCYSYIKTTEIVKHSKNLIDLIEVGDVIKLKGEEKLKYEVLKISYSKEKGKHIHIINPFRTEGGKDIFVEDIKSIVTHEQFKSIEYKI